MAIKKSELYSSLWSSCDELRGSMDASQYKDYVLVLLFIKYVSDRYAGVPYAPITIPEGASFKDMVALKGKSDIGDQINKKIIEPLAKANKLSDMPDSRAKKRLDEAVQSLLDQKSREAGEKPSRAPGWRLHDFRRTMVSAMADLGIDATVADRWCRRGVAWRGRPHRQPDAGKNGSRQTPNKWFVRYAQFEADIQNLR